MLTEPMPTQPIDSGHDNPVAVDSSVLDGYDGSRTPPDVQFEILRLHKRWGQSPSAIGQILKMNPRTVKAVIARESDEAEDARNYLKAHRLHIAQQVIRGIGNGADKGKVEGGIQLMDRLGVTEPPKLHQAQVAVQINLHGGPEPMVHTPDVVVEAILSETPPETGLI